MKKKILCIYSNKYTFIRKDVDLLAKHYEVIEFGFPSHPKWKTPLYLIKQFFFMLYWMPKVEATICMFAGYHTFLPALCTRLFNTPSTIILAGFDCYSFPSIHYGIFNQGILKQIAKFSCTHVTNLAVVHESMIDSAYTYDQADFPRQGLRYFMPRLEKTIVPMYYGYETTRFFNKQETRKPNSFVTISIDISGSTFYRKGIDLILKAAKQLPDYTFTIIGKTTDLAVEVPANVSIIPPVPYDEVNDYLNQYEFYFQLSMAEGFPNALCEAMMSGCIPIGSEVFSIPYIIGDTGFVLPKRDVNQLVELCKLAVNADKPLLSQKAGERIATNFPVSRREKEIVALTAMLIK